MRAAWAYFVSFRQAATDFAQFSRTKLTMPVMAIAGDNADGEVLGTVAVYHPAARAFSEEQRNALKLVAQLCVAQAELRGPNVAAQFRLDVRDGFGSEAARDRRGGQQEHGAAVQGRQQFRTGRRAMSTQGHVLGLRARTMQRGLSGLSSSLATPPKKRTSAKLHAVSMAARACGR